MKRQLVPALTILAAGLVRAANLPIGAGLDGIADYSHSRWFVDAMKYARTFGAAGQPWNPYTGSWAANHYPAQSFGLVVLSSLDSVYEPYMYGTYELCFHGQATVTSDFGVGVANATYDPGTGRTTADVVVPRSSPQVFLTFTDPVGMDSLRLISPGYPLDNPPLIRDEWVGILRQFPSLRFMDWLFTNGNVQKSWSDRHTPNLPGTTNPSNVQTGCAWEDVVAFANQVGRDIWINIPVNADADYVTQVATLLKNGLDPGIKVYVEYSNEVWNGQFQQFHDNLDSANAEVARGNSTLNNDGSINQYVYASRRVVRRAWEISNTFKTVWGAAAINDRVRVMVAGQLPYSHAPDLDWFDTTYQSPKSCFWGIANAPYFSASPADSDTTASTGRLLDQLQSNVGSLFDHRAMDLAAATATYYGLEWTSYEGGPDTFGPNDEQAKNDLNFDPRMETITTTFLTRWYQNGGGTFHWYVIGSGGSSWMGQYGTWSLLHWLSDSATSMKYLGLQQVADGPRPALTSGLPLPGAFPAGQVVGYPDNFDSTVTLYSAPGEVHRYEYLLNCPAAGTYGIAVRTSGATNITRATIRIDNDSLGPLGLVVADTLATSSVLAATLPKGLVTLAIDYTGVDRTKSALVVKTVAISQISLANAISPKRSQPVQWSPTALVATGRTSGILEGAQGRYMLATPQGRAIAHGTFGPGGSYDLPQGVGSRVLILWPMGQGD
jgi:hypothetical protein